MPGFLSSRSLETLNRLYAELAQIQQDPIPGFTLHATAQDMYTWSVQLDGPPGTPYTNGIFYGVLEFERNYPLVAPKLTVSTVCICTKPSLVDNQY